MKVISKGVCAPIGFKANGIHAGIRANKNKIDLALIVSEEMCSAASVYTSNLVKGAPIYVTKENISDGYAKGVIVNSGNANTCNSDGIEIAKKTCEIFASKLNMKPTDFIIASTGVIGQPLSIKPFIEGSDLIIKGLDNKEINSDLCCQGIMTTDTFKKEIAIEFVIDGKTCKMGAITKGSGMINPKLCTMLSFITTDVAISPNMLEKALKDNAFDTFNMLSVDGDTSTNDMVSVLANGMAGNKIIEEENEDYKIFSDALYYVMTYLVKKMARDGEGATKLLISHVYNAPSKSDAKIVAKSVIMSSLLKAAMFGSDANWGRVLCAIGYSGANIDIMKVDVKFISAKGSIDVCKDGYGVAFSEELAKEILLEEEITIDINLNSGEGEAFGYGCDLTYDYVKINGDYRS